MEREREERKWPRRTSPGVEYISTTEWGAQQEPPINRKSVQELIRDERIEGVVQIGRDYLIPQDAERLPPNEKARAKWREKMRKYYRGKREGE